jgi:hypothetical protein
MEILVANEFGAFLAEPNDLRLMIELNKKVMVNRLSLNGIFCNISHGILIDLVIS